MINVTYVKRIVIGIIGVILLLVILIAALSYSKKPEKIQYGMSFNTFYAQDLGLNPRKTYDAILDELQVKHLRLAAHWPMVEPRNDVYDFSELDYQVERAEEMGADVIMAVGRRLPRWPECHVPEWATNMEWEDQQQEILDYMKVVVDRYRDSKIIKYWQLENEPYLEIFAKEQCGSFDEDFFHQELDYIRALDGTRPILVTDSGNLGKWRGPYKHGDTFGTSVYVYFWNPELGQFKTVLPPWFYRVKKNFFSLIYGEKEVMLIELSAEPWLLEPVTNVDAETQYTRMNVTKLNDILKYAEDTHFEKQYLWGAEWWYWLRTQGQPEMWERGLEIFKE